MGGTCKTVNFSWLLFVTLMIAWSKYFNTRKHPLKMEFKYILFRKLSLGRFHSLCENENIPMWSTKEITSVLPGSLLRCRLTRVCESYIRLETRFFFKYRHFYRNNEIPFAQKSVTRKERSTPMQINSRFIGYKCITDFSWVLTSSEQIEQKLQKHYLIFLMHNVYAEKNFYSLNK